MTQQRAACRVLGGELFPAETVTQQKFYLSQSGRLVCSHHVPPMLALKGRGGGWQQRRWEVRGRSSTPRAAVKAQAKFQVLVTIANKKKYFTACDADLMDIVMGAMCRFKCT